MGVDPDLALSPAAEWALARFFPEELREFFLDLGVRPHLDKLGLARRVEVQQRRRMTHSQTPRPQNPNISGARESANQFLAMSINESGLSIGDLLGANSDTSSLAAGSSDPIHAACAALTALRQGCACHASSSTSASNASAT